ncbi:respiratory chain complex I subunit 1 family protein [Alicyclobacillus fastidiosus]|uniref:NADH-quinone oxidoreductase subunit H n=1 Tax=Alicyclobacillus fastidiosus TaxID=392011 RepID=A0ABV5AHY6_9BACL|nr:NADH-quinone oxidoreductase subunit H [Alicyclobacillus fastidiosus]WEH10078.1 NADH-quinone oxidoreductase subunit H [Alicyclobacillus fastidiosus]
MKADEMYVILEIVQIIFLIAVAPLIQGVVKKTKALLQGRRGPSIWQPYYDLRKYMLKDEVVSVHASWLFLITPYVVFASTIAVVAMIPVFMTDTLLSFTGQLVLVVYLFGMARFFTALSGIDTGSSFGAMGSSRDMFVSGLAEPVLFVTLLAVALPLKTTNVTLLTNRVIANHALLLSPTFYLVFLAFFILVVTETGRIPVDNPDTHLELTMIHEGMLLEYSGRRLGLMMWSAWIKQTLMFTLLIDFCGPWGISRDGHGWILIASLAFLFLKLIILAIVVAFVEMSYAKIRFFRIPRLLSAAFALSMIAIVTEYLL